MPRALLSLLTAAALGFTAARAAPPQICAPGGGGAAGRSPQIVAEYFDSLEQAPFDLRVACARWAGTFSRGHEQLAARKPAGAVVASRFIMFPAADLDLRRLASWLSRISEVRAVERAQNFLVAEFEQHISSRRLREITASPEIEYFEPDCDGPD